MLEPLEVRRAPVGALAEHEPATGEEFQDVVARLEDFALERLPAAHHVAHPLLRCTRDPYRGEIATAIQSREFTRIVLVVLPLHARPLRDQ
jgi:hypothetical protein